jgi:hypothetical protein
MIDEQPPRAPEAPPTSGTDRLRWDEGLTKTRRGHAMLHSPLRLLMAAGAIIMIIGSFLPWAQGFLGLLPVQFGGFDRASDGLILTVFAVVILFIVVRMPDFLDAPDRMAATAFIGNNALALALGSGVSCCFGQSGMAAAAAFQPRIAIRWISRGYLTRLSLASAAPKRSRRVSSTAPGSMLLAEQ